MTLKITSILLSLFFFSEVAEVAVFLASSKSSYVTGSSYEVSGGYKL